MKRAENAAFIESIDTFLGNRANRFFGDGYKRIIQEVREIEIGRDGPEGLVLSARAGVECPADWSRKGEVSQRPHLSTIDGLVIGARLGAAYLRSLSLVNGVGLVWRQVRVKAGSSPDEENLKDFPVSVRRRGNHTGPLRPGDRCDLDCRVGGMRLSWSVEAVEPGTGEPEPFDGEALRQVSQYVREVAPAHDSLAVDALVDFGAEPPWSERAVSMVDCFVVALQLGQVMLYRLDGLRREHSSTLWMRRTTINRVESCPIPDEPVVVRAELSDPRMIEQNGENWRLADIVTDFQGIRLNCSVAHRLPRP